MLRKQVGRCLGARGVGGQGGGSLAAVEHFSLSRSPNISIELEMTLDSRP